MTIITTFISKTCCVHASDSLITINDNGARKIIEDEKSKIVPIEYFRGAMSFWGLATYNGWTMRDWLSEKAMEAGNFATPIEFANYIKQELSIILAKLYLADNEKGFGIHFSAYEFINDCPIPELFTIRNFDGTKYHIVKPIIDVDRNTFDLAYDKFLEMRKQLFERNSYEENQKKIMVKRFLDEDNYFIFNNGDPILFNQAILGIDDLLIVAKHRGVLKFSDDDDNFLRKLSTLPIALISKIQADFFAAGTQIVGGNIHVISIPPFGNIVEETIEKY